MDESSYNREVMSQKRYSRSRSTSTPVVPESSRSADPQSTLQDLVGNEAIRQAMAEEMSPEECSRYEAWVPEIERCLATGAAPQSAMGNALIGIISTKLAGVVAGGVMGGTVSSGVAQNVSKVVGIQVGGAVASFLDYSRSDSDTSRSPSADETTKK